MVTSVLERERYLGRGIRLEYLTVGWNVLEGLAAVLSGMIAGSVALVGFGIDSAIESASGMVLHPKKYRDKPMDCIVPPNTKPVF